MYAKTIALTGLATLLIVTAAQSSTIALSIPSHMVVTEVHGQRIILHTSFIDEALRADVKLDIYRLTQLPSTSANYQELTQLSPADWWKTISWEVRDSAGRSRALTPRILSTTHRQRGPAALDANDRDTSVPCTSFTGSFDLGRLPVGDYLITASIAGLPSSPFPLAVRSGREPEVVDVYLQEKAHRTADWSEFKMLQLERLRIDPTKAAALIELVHRSLEFGTLEETQSYIDRAAETMEANLRAWVKLNPADAKKQARGVEASAKQLRALRRVLPEYFKNRGSWQIATDSQGHYLITTRGTNRLVRAVE